MLKAQIRVQNICWLVRILFLQTEDVQRLSMTGKILLFTTFSHNPTVKDLNCPLKVIWLWMNVVFVTDYQIIQSLFQISANARAVQACFPTRRHELLSVAVVGFRSMPYVFVWKRRSHSWTRKPNSCRTWQRRKEPSPEKSGTWRTCWRSRKGRLMSCRKRWEWRRTSHCRWVFKAENNIKYPNWIL